MHKGRLQVKSARGGYTNSMLKWVEQTERWWREKKWKAKNVVDVVKIV